MQLVEFPDTPKTICPVLWSFCSILVGERLGFSSPPRTRVVLDPSRVLPFMALDKVIDLLVTSNPFSIALFFTVMPSTRKIKPGVGTTVYTFVCFLAELIVRMTGSGVCVAGIVDCISIFSGAAA